MGGARHAGGAAPKQAGEVSRPGPRARSRGGGARLLLVGVLSGLAVAFALLNLARVEVDWILGTWQTPLIVVIAVSLLVGAALGFLLARRRLAGGGRGSKSGGADAGRA